jgi:molybdopterin-guanine dinucleotide biosynthesis protein A
MERRLRAGRLKITGFFEDVRVLVIPGAEVARHADPAVVFMNVNTPAELEHARSVASSRGGGVGEERRHALPPTQ